MTKSKALHINLNHRDIEGKVGIMQSGPNQPWSHDEQAAYLDENPDSPIGKLYGLVIPSLAPIEITRRAERITGFLSRQELPPPNLGIEELEAYIQAEILDLLAKL